MLTRKNHSESPGKLPEKWTLEVKDIFKKTYPSLNLDKDFEIYGEIYDDELLVIISTSSADNCISCHLSCDTDNDSSELLQKKLAHILDLMGYFFDNYNSTTEWDEWEPNWQDLQHEGMEYFYKISRENIALTLAANKILEGMQ